MQTYTRKNDKAQAVQYLGPDSMPEKEKENPPEGLPEGIIWKNPYGQGRVYPYFKNDQGKDLPLNRTDWIVHENDGRILSMTDDDFRKNFLVPKEERVLTEEELSKTPLRGSSSRGGKKVPKAK